MRRFFLIILIFVCSMTLSSKQIVFLIHGINSSPKAFAKMEKYLSKNYLVINWGYQSTKYDITTLSDKFLKPTLSKLSKNDTINFITHSMGALVLRAYLKKNKPKNLGKIIMIAPPNHGSDVANFFRNFFLFKKMYPINGYYLSYEGIRSLNLPDCKNFYCGIIAGTTTQLPFFSIFIRGKDDGKISVKNTKLDGMKDFVTLPYPHDTIMKKPETINQCIHFLKYGKFLRN